VKESKQALFYRFNPAVPRHYLFGIAGLLWTTVGATLCMRAINWLGVFSPGKELAFESVSVSLAVVAYTLFFSRLVQKNINRIEKLPERACAFAFTAWRGYFIIGLMISFGIWLRSTSIPKQYFSIPYSVMGVILLIGSIKFYRQYLLTLLRQRNS
jgi:hypothetical protein